MRFDYYSATVLSIPEKIVETTLDNLPYRGLTVDRQKGMHAYLHSDVITDGNGDRVCAVMHGGPNSKPHVTSSGVYSPDMATVLRGFWPGHAVSRADVAIDFDGPGAWDKLFPVLDVVAREFDLKWQTVGDFRADGDPLQGRTVYVGSRASPVFVRLYEKGKQLLSTQKVGAAAPSLDHCRLEIEVKPKIRFARVKASSLTEQQFFGCSRWARSLYSRVSSVDVERINMQQHRETDAESAVRHMAVQYKNAMQAVKAQLGGWDELNEFIESVWKQQAGEDRVGADGDRYPSQH